MAEQQDPPKEQQDGGAGRNNGKHYRRNRDQDQPPIEELYDLSQPIPRVEKPSREAPDKQLAELDVQADAKKAERQAIQDKIDRALDEDRTSVIGQKKEAVITLRNEKQRLIEEKRAIRAKLDVMRSQQDKLAKDRKDTRASVRFTNLEEIEAELRKLQRLQETTSMSLTEEKRLIKEMDQLQASKKLVADLQLKESSMEDTREARKQISADIAAKDKEIDAVASQIEAISEEIRKLSEKDSAKRDAMKALFVQRDDLRKQVNDILSEKDALRDTFREKNDAWYQYQRAIRMQKKMAYEEERRKKEEAAEAARKKREEEELAKIPYEEEMALCDYLADYLTRTYLTKGGAPTIEKHAATVKVDQVVAVKEDPFAGMVSVSRKSEEEVYIGKGKGKKKRNRNKDKSTTGPFTLNMDTFEQFGLLNLNPPTSVDQVPASVEELRAKKVWFSQQPRGSVMTATQIRKANEKEAAKIKASQSSDNAATPKKSSSSKGGGGANFSLSSDDFVPLSASTGGSASINATWGQAKADEAAAEEEQEGEVPAAAAGAVDAAPNEQETTSPADEGATS